MTIGYVNCDNITPKIASQILGTFYDAYLGDYTSSTAVTRKAVNIGKPRSDREVKDGLELVIPAMPNFMGTLEYWTCTFIWHDLESPTSLFNDVALLTKANLVHGVRMTFNPRNDEFGNLDHLMVSFNKGHIAMLGFKTGFFNRTSI